MQRMLRSILVLGLLLSIFATGAAFAAEPAGSTDAPAGATAAEPSLCGGPLFQAAAALADEASTEATDQTVTAAIEACEPCSIGTYFCGRYPYCDAGNGCCYPLKGLCNWVCV
jgi:hypothetical protein